MTALVIIGPTPNVGGISTNNIKYTNIMTEFKVLNVTRRMQGALVLKLVTRWR